VFMVYIVGWMLNYITTFLWSMGFRKKLVFLIPLFYTGIITLVRYSGTDTYEIYELGFRGIWNAQDNIITEGWEPGFVFLAKTLLLLTSSEVWAVRSIGALFIFLLLFYLLRADRTEVKFLSLYFIPVFIYQYGMNAIRAGLGLVLILLAWQALRRGKWYHFALLGLAGLTFHYSMLLPLTLLLFFELKPKDWRVSLATVLTVSLAAFFLATRREYFLSKLALYLDYDSPTEFSGISRLGIILLMWLFFAASSLHVAAKIRTFVFLVALAFGFQVLASFSYAGLRFLELMAFVVPLVLIREYERAGKVPGKVFWLGLAVTGVLGAAFVYRNFLSDFDGQMTGTLTPFLPYRTIFDYKP